MQTKEELAEIAKTIKSPTIRKLVENLWRWPEIVAEEQGRWAKELEIAEKHFGKVARIVVKEWGSLPKLPTYTD
jgi:hypothetical protein